FASAIFPVAAWTTFHIYLIHMLAYLALITPIALFWIFLGSVLAANKVRWLNQSNLQRTASLVLVSFSIPISYSALLNL
ncbi:LysE family translocator, partial [Acinetobacter baumannii]